MAREVAFKLKAVSDVAAAKKGLLDLSAALSAQEKLQKKIGEIEKRRITESGTGLQKLRFWHGQVTEAIKKQEERTEKLLEKQRKVFDHLRLGAGAIGGGLGSLVSIVGTAATEGFIPAAIEGGMKLFEKGVEFVKEAGRFTVEKAVELYREGKKDVELKQRFEREFGAQRAVGFLRAAGMIGSRAGIEQSAAGEGLLVLREAMPEITAGMRVTADLAKQLGMGGRRTLTQSDAENLEAQMVARRGGLLARLQTLRPDIDPAVMARSLGNVASGLGARQFASMLGLGKQAERIIAANEAGKLGKKGAELSRLGLSQADLAAYDLDKGRLRAFDVIDLVLKKRGLTEEAAGDKRKTLDFQIQSIKATLGDVFSDIGTRVFEGLNGPLKEGVTLAEAFKGYIESEKGQRMIQNVADALGKAAGFIGDMVAKLPGLLAQFDRWFSILTKIGEFLQPLVNTIDVVSGAKAARETAGRATLATSAILNKERDESGPLTKDQYEAAQRAGMALAEKVGGSGRGGLPPLSLSVGNITTGVGQTPDQIASALSGPLINLLTDHIRRHTAGGAASHAQ